MRNFSTSAGASLAGLALIVIAPPDAEARKGGRFVAGLALGLAGAAIVKQLPG